MKTIFKEIKWFFRQLRRSLGYFKASWGGYDWDYSYSINMFKYSLTRLQKHLDSNGHFSCSPRNTRRLKTIIELMEKVYNDEYAFEYQDKMKALYGENVLDFWSEDTGRGDGTTYLRFEYEKWEHHKEEIDIMHSKLMAESRFKQDRAHELLWKLIEHNIQYFWD
jgi:hypothetical protein